MPSEPMQRRTSFARLPGLLVVLATAAIVLLLVAGEVGAQPEWPPRSYVPHVTRDGGLIGPDTTLGRCDTGVQTQNLSTDSTMMASIGFYPQDRREPSWLSSFPVAPLGSTLYYLPTVDVPDGLSAAIVYADQPAATIARTDCVAGGKAAMYGQARPGPEVAVPLAVAHYYGQCSILTVQNPDTEESIEARIELTRFATSDPEYTATEAIGPGTSVTLDLCELRHPGDYPLLDFVGSAIVTAGGADVAVMSYVDITTSSMALYAFEGVPTDAAANQLYAPLIRSRQQVRVGASTGHMLDTGIAVVNPSDKPTDVYVRYYGAPGNPVCGGGYYEHNDDPVAVPAHSSVVFYQGPAEQPLTGMHPLPEGCYGSAKIISDPEPVLAVVNDSLDMTATSAAYNALSDDDAGTRIVLPLFRSGHTSWALYTGIMAMNTGNEVTDITVTAYPSDGGTDDVVSATAHDVGVNETAAFWPGDFANAGWWGDSNRSYGSAIVTSEQPVVVVVNDWSLAGAADPATYTGLKVE
ncbi:MAG: hypothetical protein ACK2T6_00305 [Anaerolineae bacterium]